MEIFFVGSDRRSRPSPVRATVGDCTSTKVSPKVSRPTTSFFCTGKVPPPTIEGAEWLDKRARDHA